VGVKVGVRFVGVKVGVCGLWALEWACTFQLKFCAPQAWFKTVGSTVLGVYGRKSGRGKFVGVRVDVALGVRVSVANFWALEWAWQIWALEWAWQIFTIF